MENLHDYSNYVFAAYAVAGLVTSGLLLVVIGKYLSIKSKIKNEKSA